MAWWKSSRTKQPFSSQVLRKASPVIIGSGLIWIALLVFFYSVTQSFAGHTAVRNWIYGSSLAIIILGGIIQLMMIQKIVQKASLPIHDLGRAASRIRNGCLDQRMKTSDTRELSDLAEAFNLMVDQLINSNIVLEQKALEANHLAENLRVTQEELVQLQKMEAVGKLAGGMAHDFNNLLGSILAYASMLKAKFKDDEKVHRQLETIEKSALRGSELTQKILGFARKGQYKKVAFNLNEVALEAQSLLYRTVDKTVTIRADLKQDAWPIEGDSSQVLQVLMNLGVNARDAMPSGGELIISTSNLVADEDFCKFQRKIKPGNYVRITISDNGTGIPVEIRDKIFDPFFTTKAVGKGTGLGLAMAYGILQNHGGQITVYSEIGKGTSFHLYFPARENAQLKAVETSPGTPEQTSNSLLEGMRILVIEDDELIRMLVKDVLEGQGAAITLAFDGAYGVEAFETSSDYDLILLDVIMPRMDGIHAFRLLREIREDIPIVFNSGYAESGEISKLRQEGRVGFIQKPYRASELVRAILALEPSRRSRSA